MTFEYRALMPYEVVAGDHAAQQSRIYQNFNGNEVASQTASIGASATLGLDRYWPFKGPFVGSNPAPIAFNEGAAVDGDYTTLLDKPAGYIATYTIGELMVIDGNIFFSIDVEEAPITSDTIPNQRMQDLFANQSNRYVEDDVAGEPDPQVVPIDTSATGTVWDVINDKQRGQVVIYEGDPTQALGADNYKLTGWTPLTDGPTPTGGWTDEEGTNGDWTLGRWNFCGVRTYDTQGINSSTLTPIPEFRPVTVPVGFVALSGVIGYGAIHTAICWNNTASTPILSGFSLDEFDISSTTATFRIQWAPVPDVAPIVEAFDPSDIQLGIFTYIGTGYAYLMSNDGLTWTNYGEATMTEIFTGSSFIANWDTGPISVTGIAPALGQLVFMRVDWIEHVDGSVVPQDNLVDLSFSFQPTRLPKALRTKTGLIAGHT